MNFRGNVFDRDEDKTRPSGWGILPAATPKRWSWTLEAPFSAEITAEIESEYLKSLVEE